MKKILTVLLVMVMVLPTFVFAKSNKYIEKYKTMNFKETLKDESITLENKTYKENDKQITIYLFRGKGCPHCEDFLNFLNSISPEYGKYFKLVSFEVWYDKTNSELMSNVGKFLDKDIAGVPFIIIGDKTYAGYAETYDEDIKKAISNGFLIKVQEKDHCIFETEIDKEKGWRIVRKYYDNYKPPYVSRFYYDVYATYDEAKEKADEIKAELDRQANLTDYEWSVEQIDKMLYKAAKFNYITEEQAKEFRQRLLALDDVEEVCCRVCNRSVQWKYDHHKKWKTLK